MKIFAETKRLILREIVPEDAAAMFEMDSDPDVHRYLGNHPVKSIDEIKNVIQFVRQQYTDNGIGRWAIEEKSTGNFMGWTGLKLVTAPINNHVNYYDLGYRLLKRYWGKGIASETAVASLKYGFDNMNLDIIYGMADVDNVASNAILKKAGLKYIETFIYDGAKHHWYKITKGEWLQL